VLLHGFTDTWRTWELVLPALERTHEVLAPALLGHAGGPPVPESGFTEELLIGEVERAMDEAGFETAFVAGNSLGGYLALQLAARGRARAVVALAPAGGWRRDDAATGEMLAYFRMTQDLVRAAAPYADAIVASPEGRRRATAMICERYEHIPRELIAHQIVGVAGCSGAVEMLESVQNGGYGSVDLEAVRCPVRIVWGAEDKLLRWPEAAELYRSGLPDADWVLLGGVGHCPQLDVPAETASLITGFMASAT
jgi:pimeloyl-ACP methyl ester carboxylesterase